MKFCIATIIIINYISASRLFGHLPNPFVCNITCMHSTNRMYENINCQDMVLTFNHIDNIEEKSREIRAFKKEIKKVEFLFIPSNYILKMLEECALHLENSIRLEIVTKMNDSADLPTISDSFYNLKISSLHLRGYNLHPTLKKAIYNLLIKNKKIKSLEYSFYNIDSLFMNDIISILKNEDVDIDLLFFDHVNITENALISLFDIVSTIEGPEIAFNDLLIGISQLKNHVLNILKTGSIIPNLSVNQTIFGKYKWKFNIFSLNNSSKIILYCNLAEYEDCLKYLEAILKNTKIDITEVDIQFEKYKRIGDNAINEDFEIFSAQFSEIFKKLCNKKIYLSINGWLTNEQEKIMEEIKLENIKQQELLNNEQQKVETIV